MKSVTVDPTSDLNELLNTADHEPVELLRSGVRYRLVRDDEELFANYDPERAQASLDRAFGGWKGIDAKALIDELHAQRDQDSEGRPAE
jgi:hypothetical protein